MSANYIPDRDQISFWLSPIEVVECSGGRILSRNTDYTRNRLEEIYHQLVQCMHANVYCSTVMIFKKPTKEILTWFTESWVEKYIIDQSN